MRLRDLQISTETFYKVGIFCFATISLMNLLTLRILWGETMWFGKIASVASIIFYAGLAMFFNYLLNMTRPDIKEEYASEDVEGIIKKIKGDEGDKHIRVKKKNKKSKPETQTANHKK